MVTSSAVQVTLVSRGTGERNTNGWDLTIPDVSKVWPGGPLMTKWHLWEIKTLSLNLLILYYYYFFIIVISQGYSSFLMRFCSLFWSFTGKKTFDHIDFWLFVLWLNWTLAYITYLVTPNYIPSYFLIICIAKNVPFWYNLSFVKVHLDSQLLMWSNSFLSQVSNIFSLYFTLEPIISCILWGWYL